MMGPHALALALTPEEYITLERWVAFGGPALPNGDATPIALLLSIAKRVLLFQRHVNEAIIAHDHRDDRAFVLPPASRDSANQLCRAWYVAGGRLEAIENGVDTLDVDWRPFVWNRVAATAKAIYGSEPVFDGVACPACHEFGDCMARCPHAGLPRNEQEHAG